MSRAQPLSFRSIGDSLTAAMSNANRPMAMRGGSARSIFDLTVQNLRARVAEQGGSTRDIEFIVGLAEKWFEHGLKLCESPIECMVLAALINADWPHFMAIAPAVHDARRDKMMPAGEIVIVPQFAFARVRVDFAIVARCGENQKIVAVECDGEEFHDPRKDFDRDQYIKQWGIETFRLKGADIHRDVVRAVIDPVYAVGEWKRSNKKPILA